MVNNKISVPLTIFPKNRLGWIQIVEAVVAVLLVATVLLITINKGYIGKSDISESVYKTELSILREVQTNESLRKEIVNIQEGDLPLKGQDFPNDISDKIISRTPSYLTCVGAICDLEVTCELDSTSSEDIYAQSIIISESVAPICSNILCNGICCAPNKQSCVNQACSNQGHGNCDPGKFKCGSSNNCCLNGQDCVGDEHCCDKGQIWDASANDGAGACVGSSIVSRVLKLFCWTK